MQQTAQYPAGLRGRGLIIWTIYRNPRDYPGLWVLRPYEVDEGLVSSPIACLSDSLKPLRAPLEARGLVMFPRQPDDDAPIVETWF